MEKKRIMEKITSERLIPVIRVPTTSQAMDVAQALMRGGSHLIEVTMTVEGALEVIKTLRGIVPEGTWVGAGTVLDGRMAAQALEAGAQFIVSPSLSMEAISVARQAEAVVIPGAMTPTEVLKAWEAGADLVKVFPVSALGGPSYIRALKGPLPHIGLVPTGGVSPDNAPEFIRAGAVAVGMGSELIDKESLKNGDYEAIAQKTRMILQVLSQL